MASSQDIRSKFGNMKTRIDNLEPTSEQVEKVNSQIKKLYRHARTLTCGTSAEIYGDGAHRYDENAEQIVNPNRVEKICSILEPIDKDRNSELQRHINEAIETERVKFDEASFKPEAFASAIADAASEGIITSRIECIHEEIKNFLESLLTDSNRFYRIFLLDKLKPVLTQLDELFKGYELVKNRSNDLEYSTDQWITSYSHMLDKITLCIDKITQIVVGDETNIEDLPALDWLRGLSEDNTSSEISEDNTSSEIEKNSLTNLSSMCQTQIDKDRGKILLKLKEAYRDLNNDNNPAHKTIDDFIVKAEQNENRYCGFFKLRDKTGGAIKKVKASCLEESQQNLNCPTVPQ